MRGDGVDDETLAQVVGKVEPSILDLPEPRLQRLEEKLDGAPQLIPLRLAVIRGLATRLPTPAAFPLQGG